MNLDNRNNAILSTAPLYAGSTYYYAYMLKHHTVQFSLDMPIGKLWAPNHCNIIGPNGVQALTIPLVKPNKGSHTPLRELEISTHGNWEHLHWGALFSSYGKAPFFEHVASDLEGLYRSHSRWLVDFNLALHQLVVDFMQLPISIDTTSTAVDSIPKQLYTKTPSIDDEVRYYQIWEQRFGFAPGLSILDLMMNEGPQGIFTLIAMSNRIM